MCVNNLPRVICVKAERPGLEPACYWLQVRCPDHTTRTTVGYCQTCIFCMPLFCEFRNFSKITGGKYAIISVLFSSASKNAKIVQMLVTKTLFDDSPTIIRYCCYGRRSYVDELVPLRRGHYIISAPAEIP